MSIRHLLSSISAQNSRPLSIAVKYNKLHDTSCSKFDSSQLNYAMNIKKNRLTNFRERKPERFQKPSLDKISSSISGFT